MKEVLIQNVSCAESFNENYTEKADIIMTNQTRQSYTPNKVH